MEDRKTVGPPPLLWDSSQGTPEERLLARIELAERQYAEGKCHPASEVSARLRAIADGKGRS